MPQLISSASSGSAAPPKAPPRRRPASAAQPTPTPAPSVTASSPPPTHSAVVSVAKETPRSKPAASGSRPAGATAIEVDTQTAHVPQRATPAPAQHVHIPTVPTPEPTQAPVTAPAQQEERRRGSSPFVRPEEYQLQNTHIVNDPVQGPEDAVVPDTTATPELSTTSKTAKGKQKRVRKEKAAPASAPQAKRAKKTSTRSNAVVQAATHGTTQNAEESPQVMADQVAASTAQTLKRNQVSQESTPKSKPKRKTKAKVKAVERSAAIIVNSDDEDEFQPTEPTGQDTQDVGEESEAEQPAPVKQKRRRRRKIVPPTGEEGETGEQLQPHQDAEDDEDEAALEAHEIVPEELSMFNLSYDRIHGKQSQRGKEMAAIDWDEENRIRQEEAERAFMVQFAGTAEAVVQSTEGPDGAAQPTPEGEGADAEARAASTALYEEPEVHPEDEVRLEVVDGELQIVTESLLVSRDAQAIAAAHGTEYIVEENDLKSRINRHTWMNKNKRDPAERDVPVWKSKSDPWTEEETDRFYEALGMLGTDFMMISEMFPRKNRRMIKLKFVREERLDPKRINDVLLGTNSNPMTLERWAQETGREMSVYTKYDGVEHAKSMIDADLEGKEDAMTAAVREQEAEAVEKEKKAKEKEKQKRRDGRSATKARARKGVIGGGGLFGGVWEPEDAGGGAEA